jgi:hypothetical protein
MKGEVRIPETSVNFNVTTRRYIPEHSKFHIRRRKNLKSHLDSHISFFSAESVISEIFENIYFSNLSLLDLICVTAVVLRL